MILSPHFTLEEFEHGSPVPEECVPIFIRLAEQILEPIRAQAGVPLIVTSGYRSEAQNASPAVHGAAHSEHVASASHCACDFYPQPINGFVGQVRGLFDWIRQTPSIPFHQVTLEHSANGSSIIHISINEDFAGVRQALEGATHNATPYKAWEVAAYNPGEENA